VNDCLNIIMKPSRGTYASVGITVSTLEGRASCVDSSTSGSVKLSFKNYLRFMA